MPEVLDVALETDDGGYFQFLNVRAEALMLAVDQALADGVALSLVNADSCALVIPWKLIKSITYVDSSAEERDDAWTTLWERVSESVTRKAG